MAIDLALLARADIAAAPSTQRHARVFRVLSGSGVFGGEEIQANDINWG